MGVRADDGLAGGHEALFRQQRVFDAHLSHVVEVVDVELPREGAALFALGGGLDVLVRHKVIHHQRDAALVEDLIEPRRLELVDGHGRGDVVGQHQVELRLDELPGVDLIQARVLCQNLLRHCHCQFYIPPKFIESFILRRSRHRKNNASVPTRKLSSGPA